MSNTKEETPEETVVVVPKHYSKHSLKRIIAPDYTGPRMIASFDSDHIASVQMVVAATQAPTFRGEELGGEFFPVVNWVITPAEYEGKDGEDDQLGVRLTFFNHDGETLSVGSEAVVRAWEALVSMKGNGPYDPPILLGLEPIINKNQRRTYRVKIG